SPNLFRARAQRQRQASSRGRSLCPRRPEPALRRCGQGDGSLVAKRGDQDRPGDRSVEMTMRERRSSGVFVFIGILMTLAVHLGVVGGLLLSRAVAQNAPPLGPGSYLDAQLVKFGKPRDLSFLPHKQGQVKVTGPPEGLQIATSADAKPKTKD